jgi:hypothetical protein
VKWSLITKFTISQPEEKKNQQTPRTALTPPTHRTYKSLLKEFFFFSSFILNEEISGKNMKEKKERGRSTAQTDTPRLRFSQELGLCIVAAQLVIVLLYLLWT